MLDFGSSSTSQRVLSRPIAFLLILSYRLSVCVCGEWQNRTFLAMLIGEELVGGRLEPIKTEAYLTCLEHFGLNR